MNILDELEELKELVNDDKKFKYKATANFILKDIKKELDYASNCHNLEESVGCPLDVVVKLFRQDFIYFKYLSNVQTMKVKVIKGLSYGSNPGWYFTCIYDNVDFIYISLRDYKKTWWLKEDKSE